MVDYGYSVSSVLLEGRNALVYLVFVFVTMSLNPIFWSQKWSYVSHLFTPTIPSSNIFWFTWLSNAYRFVWLLESVTLEKFGIIFH